VAKGKPSRALMEDCFDVGSAAVEEKPKGAGMYRVGEADLVVYVP
jgi:hypothetical protein